MLNSNAELTSVELSIYSPYVSVVDIKFSPISLLGVLKLVEGDRNVFIISKIFID